MIFPMKNILIATDFTPAAQSAGKYAVQLAKDLDCGLCLLSVYSPVPVALSNSLTSVSVLDKGRVTKVRLDEEAGLLDVRGLPALTLLAREGGRVDTILEVAEQLNAGLIVTGMKSSGKKTRRVFGSTITGLMHRSHLPVLVIPEGFGYHTPANLTLGDRYMHSQHEGPVDALQRIIATFDPKIFVYEHLAWNTDSQGLNEFIREYNIDMVVLEPQYRTALARWFLRSHTREMVFKACIPLMILPKGR